MVVPMAEEWAVAKVERLVDLLASEMAALLGICLVVNLAS